LGRLEPYGLLTPALIMLALFFFFPALYNLYLSLRELSLFQLSTGGTYVGLDNYVELFQDPDTGLILLNTAFWLTLVTVVIRLVLGVGLALMLDSEVLRRWRLSGVATTLMLIPWMVAPVVTVAVWQWMLHPRYGAFNHILLDLRLIDQGIPFLVNVSTVWWAVIAMIVWRELPFTAISVLAGLQAIPVDLYEAARIDGANRQQVFARVTLPLLRPTLVVVTMLTTLWTFNNFVYVWLATRGGPGNYTQVLATQVYNEAFVNYRLGYGSALGVLMGVLMLLFSILYFVTVFRRSVAQP
jgi:multiple sugar transport system permease protein